jgi:lipopolysaccharide export system protein LptA
MAEIKGSRKHFQILSFRNLLVLLILLFFSFPLYCQQTGNQKKGKRKIHLIYSELCVVDDKMGSDLSRLLGKVTLQDPENNMMMMCDSAYLYENSNQVKAFSRVHIQQGDTLNLYGDYLFYDGVEKNATVSGNVELIDKETHLFTRTVNYDVTNQIAKYPGRGKIINAKNTLTSLTGTYYVTNKLFHFKDSVKIVNPDYVMTADTMDYNTESETAFFTGPTELKGDSIYIYCKKGWYDTKKDISRIWIDALIDNKQQIIKGDSLFYDKTTGFGQAFRNVSISDTTNDVMVTGDIAWYHKEPERFMVTGMATFIQISKGDSLFLHADSINAVTITPPDTTIKPFRLMRAYYGCRIFSKDLQAKCDSLSYSFLDSVIRLYYKPVLWSEENQLTSDSVSIFTKNRQAERMELYNTAFVVSKVDTVRFNQIKGRNLTGYFKDNKLYKILIEGNGESVYHLIDKEKLTGVTHNKSSSIEIYVDKGKITDIIEHQNPDGKLDPPLLNPPDKMILPGFNWFDAIRPKKKADIYQKTVVEFPKDDSAVTPANKQVPPKKGILDPKDAKIPPKGNKVKK